MSSAGREIVDTRAAPARTGTRALAPRAAGALLADHGAAAIRAALVRRWASGAGISPSRLATLPAVARLLDEGAGGDADAAVARLAPGAFTLKDVEAGFAATLDAQSRRAQGTVYTPDFVIDYLIREGLAMRAVEFSAEPPVVCNPACGSGGFLLRAAAILARDLGIPPERALARHVVGIDNDPPAIAQARALVELYLTSLDRPVGEHPVTLVEADALLTPPADLIAMTPHGRAFDLVATNPPYVRLQTLAPAHRDRLRAAYGNLVRGSFSLALAFLVAGQRLLARGGILAMITQNNLATSLAGEGVRALVQRERWLRRIVDFGAHPVFAGASAYTCLVFLGESPRERFEVATLSVPPSAESLAAARLATTSHAALDAAKWRLHAPSRARRIATIERAGPALGEVAEIRVGFATLKDAVFLARREGERCIATFAGERHEIEPAATRAAVKVAGLGGAGDLAASSSCVLFPYERVDGGRYRVLEEERLAELYPRAHAYLVRCRPALATRDKGRRAYEAWYAWGRTQGRDAPGPKLLTKTFNARPGFLLDPTDRLFCNGYSIRLRPGIAPPALSIELLAALLNSQVMHYYATLTSFTIAGGYRCYQKNFIERFGIPAIAPSQAREILAADPVVRERHIADCYGVPGTELAEMVAAARTADVPAGPAARRKVGIARA